jgi:hypothetical protein
MCTDNLWTCEGLVNGAMGQVKAIVYNLRDDIACSLPVVFVDFQSYCGPPFFESQPTIVPIGPSSREGLKVRHNGATVNATRVQLPLQLSSAITIHKSQGLTAGPGQYIQKLLIDVGDNESWCEGLAYVAISRAMYMQTFALDPMQPLARWQSIGKSEGAKRTQAWLRRLELTAAFQHVIRCGSHTSSCSICQNIRVRQGSHENHSLQSFLDIKDQDCSKLQMIVEP